MQKTGAIHQGMCILVVDDSRVAREMVVEGIKRVQEKRFIQVVTAENGAEALKYFSKRKIDLAFVDVHMPELNGMQLMNAIEGTLSENCVLVAMSTDMSGGTEEKLQELGAYHFLPKPFTKDDVAGLIWTYVTMSTRYPVLVVDDSATMRGIARKLLEGSRFHFDIVEADSGAAALEAMREKKFRVVLTDYNMPDMDGLELAGLIKARSSKVKVYMMSTNKETFVERSAAFVGVEGYLRKPFTSADIDMIMHRALKLDDPKFGKKSDLFSFISKERYDYKGLRASQMTYYEATDEDEDGDDGEQQAEAC